MNYRHHLLITLQGRNIARLRLRFRNPLGLGCDSAGSNVYSANTEDQGKCSTDRGGAHHGKFLR